MLQWQLNICKNNKNDFVIGDISIKRYIKIILYKRRSILAFKL